MYRRLTYVFVGYDVSIIAPKLASLTVISNQPSVTDREADRSPNSVEEDLDTFPAALSKDISNPCPLCLRRKTSSGATREAAIPLSAHKTGVPSAAAVEGDEVTGETPVKNSGSFQSLLSKISKLKGLQQDGEGDPATDTGEDDGWGFYESPEEEDQTWVARPWMKRVQWESDRLAKQGNGKRLRGDEKR